MGSEVQDEWRAVHEGGAVFVIDRRSPALHGLEGHATLFVFGASNLSSRTHSGAENVALATKRRAWVATYYAEGT